MGYKCQPADDFNVESEMCARDLALSIHRAVKRSACDDAACLRLFMSVFKIMPSVRTSKDVAPGL